jgi:hypothetical protein
MQRKRHAADNRLPADKQAECKLSAEQVRLLDGLRFTWSPSEDNWLERYEELKAFAAANGHARVPRQLDGNQPLAEWATRQRRIHEKTPEKLSPEHRSLLDAVGFVYNPRDESFEAGFVKLQAYAASHYGSTEVVSGKYAEDQSFGLWVRDKRTACVKNKLAENFVAQLASLSYAWSDSDAAFAHGVQQLTAFATAHGGSTAVPHGEDVTKEIAQLHEWCRMQRLRRVQSTLSEQRIAQLDALGFSWKSRS